MHEEASYEGLDPIECEIRRRTFWLLFGGKSMTGLFPLAYSQPSAADKSMSILLGRPIALRDRRRPYRGEECRRTGDAADHWRRY